MAYRMSHLSVKEDKFLGLFFHLKLFLSAVQQLHVENSLTTKI